MPNWFPISVCSPFSPCLCLRVWRAGICARCRRLCMAAKIEIIALNENSIITLELTLLSIFEMNEQQNASQHEANWTDDDVSVAEEWIFTAENRCCREDEKLRSVELLYWVVCGMQLIFMNIKLTSPSASKLTVINFQIIFSARQFVASKFTASVNNTTVKFSEAGQRCCSHPHN